MQVVKGALEDILSKIPLFRGHLSQNSHTFVPIITHIKTSTNGALIFQELFLWLFLIDKIESQFEFRLYEYRRQELDLLFLFSLSSCRLGPRAASTSMHGGCFVVFGTSHLSSLWARVKAKPGVESSPPLKSTILMCFTNSVLKGLRYLYRWLQSKRWDLYL